MAFHQTRLKLIPFIDRIIRQKALFMAQSGHFYPQVHLCGLSGSVVSPSQQIAYGSEFEARRLLLQALKKLGTQLSNIVYLNIGGQMQIILGNRAFLNAYMDEVNELSLREKKFRQERNKWTGENA